MIQYIISVITRYITGVFLAISNKPVTEIVYKQERIYTPLNKEHIEKLTNLFPLPVYKQGDSLVDIAHETGKYEVVQYIKQWSARGGEEW